MFHWRGREIRFLLKTHTEEFHEVIPFSLPIAQLNRKLQAWEKTYNTLRPLQALGYLTPLEFLAQSSPQRKYPKCHYLLDEFKGFPFFGLTRIIGLAELKRAEPFRFHMANHSSDDKRFSRHFQADLNDARRGSLKVFLGYASGVGKSARMLDEARRRKERGEDVVVGATQPVVTNEVRDLLLKLEVIPQKTLDEMQFMDIDAILARHPQVCVIDGLAYLNHPLSYHTHRWEDAEELLASGISLLASINLQYIDAYKQEAERITGKHSVEAVPLNFLRSAEEIEVVDAPPEMTLQREAPGKEEGIAEDNEVAVKQRKLAELREMVLLLTADIVEHQLETYMQQHDVEQLWGTQERILVCVKVGVNARQMIESGRRNADRFHGELHVVHVRQTESSPNPKDESVLEENLRYARNLNAQVEILEEEEWTASVLQFAHEHRITQIFIHHSRNARWGERIFGSGVDRLITSAEGIDIRVFPE